MVVRVKRGTNKISNLPLKERLAKGTYKVNNHGNKTTGTRKLFSPRTSLTNIKTPIKKTKYTKPTRNKAEFFKKHFNPVEVDLDASNGFDFLKNEEQINKIRKKSDEFYNNLIETNNGFGYSDIIVFDEKILDGMVKDMNDTCVALLNNPEAASYGLIIVPPKSACGPIINTKGITIIVFLDVQDNKVLFESMNLDKKNKVICYKQVQLLILPDDIFIIHNQSISVTAKLLIISCKKDGKELNDIK